MAKKAPAKKKTALIDPENFVILGDDSDALEAMTFNLQGESIDEFDLDRVRVPAGGLTVFETPEGDAVKEIEGIIVQVQQRRAYWEKAFGDGGNVPPDCSSTDGLVGIGDPGGNCAHCPFNQFGTAVKQDGSAGRGKRCRESRALFLIRAEDHLPLVIVAPATSIKGVKQYLMKLPVRRTQAVTKLTLVKDKSADGIEYARIVFDFVGKLPAEFAEPLTKYNDALGAVLTPQAPRLADFSAGGGAVQGAINSTAKPVVDELLDAVDDVPDDVDDDYDEEPPISDE